MSAVEGEGVVQCAKGKECSSDVDVRTFWYKKNSKLFAILCGRPFIDDSLCEQKQEIY